MKKKSGNMTLRARGGFYPLRKFLRKALKAKESAKVILPARQLITVFYLSIRKLIL